MEDELFKVIQILSNLAPKNFKDVIVDLLAAFKIKIVIQHGSN